jgi:hypothetical protein
MIDRIANSPNPTPMPVSSIEMTVITRNSPTLIVVASSTPLGYLAGQHWPILTKGVWFVCTSVASKMQDALRAYLKT